MRQINGIVPYSDWEMNLSCRWNIEIEPLGYDVIDFSAGSKTVERAYRTRVVIEGETAIVQELLGKNFLARQKRVRAEHSKDQR